MEFWVLILTLWAFYRWVQSRIRRKKEDERFANVIEALNCLEPRLNDLKKLESRVAELERHFATSAPPTATAVSPRATTASPPPPAREPVDVPSPLALPKVEIPKTPAPTPAPPAAHPVEPPMESSAPPHKPAPPPPTSPRPIPPPLSPPPKPASVSAREATSQFEELLGKNWLSKIGIAAIVIGMAYFLGAEFHKLSNP